MNWVRKNWPALWQVAFILLGSTWLWAPQLNHLLSYKITLISEYEAPGQPYNWLFRTGDILAAGLFLAAVLWLNRRQKINRLQFAALGLIGLGLLLDPTFASACRIDQVQCRQNISFSFIIHALETTFSAAAIVFICIYDAWARRRLVSIVFTAFQVGYGLLLLSQLATHNHFNTLSQYIYQLATLVWLAWYVYELIRRPVMNRLQPPASAAIRNTVAAWAFINGALAILVSLTHIHLLGHFKSLYFAGDTAWLAQHGVVVGVIMIYLSRHLARGEQRARQLFLVICALEVLKFSIITPHPFLVFYLLTFCALFVLRTQFYRGTVLLTWRNRLKEAAFMAGSLAAVIAAGLIFVDLDNERAEVTVQALDHFVDYGLKSDIHPRNHVASVLLDHTITALILITTAIIMWILFRPAKRLSQPTSKQQVRQVLEKYSASSEDYFKLWPADKDYFWSADGQGFIAYKIAGSTLFALADPVTAPGKKLILIKELIAESRAGGLKISFLPIFQPSLKLYQRAGLSSVQIGSSAMINIDQFLKTTSQNKWWRWKLNRARKQAYSYELSRPPHPKKLLTELRQISNSWLKKGGRRERGFSLGYFNRDYLQNCQLHYLRDAKGRAIAFTNQLPLFSGGHTATIDLLRYRADADDAMPYLLFKTIENLAAEQKFKNFDLGFVPFTSSKDPIVNAARLLSAGRFSAKGLEQFKNKFEPDWQNCYLAYDGDLADLALLGLNLERAMAVDL